MKMEWKCKSMEEKTEASLFLLPYWEHILQGKFLKFLLLCIERNNKGMTYENSAFLSNIYGLI